MIRLPRVKAGHVRLYLCRHGQTHANVQNLIQGSGVNSQLTDLGVLQAIELSSALKSFNLGKLASSPLDRAISTARPLESNGLPVEVFEQLKEMEYGSLEGLPIANNDTMAMMRALWSDWKDDVSKQCPGVNGESLADLIFRAENILYSIAQDSAAVSKSPHVAVISHSMFLRAVLAKFSVDKRHLSLKLKQPTKTMSRSTQIMEAMDKIQLANSSITVVDFDTNTLDGQTRAPPDILLINSTEHVHCLTDDKTIGMTSTSSSSSSSSSTPTSSTTSTSTSTTTSTSTITTSTSHKRRLDQLHRHLSTSTTTPDGDGGTLTPHSNARRVVVGSDHGGFDLKVQLVEHLQTKGFIVHDVGCHDTTSVDYPDIAALAGKATLDESNALQRGIVVCGSGVGISIAANKVPGVRCALLHDHYGAVMCRKHNNANMIALGGRTTGIEIAKEIVDTFLTTEFDGGRHAARVEKIESC